jgi:dihydropteroate synthase
MIGSATWTVSGGRVLGPAPFLLAGIVNATPDSFFDGGSYLDPLAALARCDALVSAGADMLDIGGESTRPGAPDVPADEELRRVMPVLRGLAKRRPASADALRPVLSVDTYKAVVASEALAAGAEVINDISACRFDPELMDVVAGHKPGYVLMHSQGRPRGMQNDPRYDDVVSEILAFFEERMAALVKAGLPEANIALDPGIGFGKLLEHNVAILRGMERFGALGRPLYIGLSNKSLWGKMLGLESADRGLATSVATALLVSRGALVHRVHDVAAARQAARLATAIAPQAA